jgi:hypothetical protein
LVSTTTSCWSAAAKPAQRWRSPCRAPASARYRSSIRRDIPLVTVRISRDLFLADLDSHEQRINGTIAADFPDEAYVSAIWKPPG